MVFLGMNNYHTIKLKKNKKTIKKLEGSMFFVNKNSPSSAAIKPQLIFPIWNRTFFFRAMV